MNKEIKVIPVTFKKRGQYGDFAWMIEQSEYQNSILIFNDNIEQHNTPIPGCGSSVIRQYNQHSSLLIPRSYGIPTSSNGRGFQNSLDGTMNILNFVAIEELKRLIKKHDYDTLYFPVKDEDKLFDCGIFDVYSNVRRAISYSLEIISYLDNESYLEYIQNYIVRFRWIDCSCDLFESNQMELYKQKLNYN